MKKLPDKKDKKIYIRVGRSDKIIDGIVTYFKRRNPDMDMPKSVAVRLALTRFHNSFIKGRVRNVTSIKKPDK